MPKQPDDPGVDQSVKKVKGWYEGLPQWAKVALWCAVGLVVLALIL